MHIINETNLYPQEYLKPGTICMYLDNNEVSTLCTIKYVELSDNVHNLVYYYLMANNEELNNKSDPRFPWTYFRLSDSSDTKLIPISSATVQ